MSAQNMSDPAIADQVIGIDLGGSAIKLGRFDRSGQCLQSISVPTPQPQYPEPVLAAIAQAIDRLDPNRQALAVGIGTPGPADITARIARIAINLPGWSDVPVADWLEPKIERPVIVANDANCAAVGEAWLGAGQPFQNMIMLTLGTGCGGAIILGGELYVGHNGAAGELGLVTLNPDGPPCQSGNRGSLEQYASIGAIQRRFGLAPHAMAKLAEQGDAAAIAHWQAYGQTLGAGMTSAIYVLTPEAVILGGGISASARWFLPAAIAEIEARVHPSSRQGLQILSAALGNQAGMVGSAKLAWKLA
jgi:glucokinase